MLKRNRTAENIIDFIIVAIIVLCLCSCSSQSGKRNPVKCQFKRVVVIDSSGVKSIATVDTLLKKDDIIRINGKVYAIQ